MDCVAVLETSAVLKAWSDLPEELALGLQHSDQVWKRIVSLTGPCLELS